MRRAVFLKVPDLSPSERGQFEPLIQALCESGTEPSVAFLPSTARSARLWRQEKSREFKRLRAAGPDDPSAKGKPARPGPHKSNASG